MGVAWKHYLLHIARDLWGVLCRYALTVWFKREAAAAPVTESAARRSVLTQKAQLCPQPARSPAEQIFVSIAAFRDAEARWTVRDLLQKASQAGRVRVGIVWQVDAASEAELMELPIPASQRSQVRLSALAGGLMWVASIPPDCPFLSHDTHLQLQEQEDRSSNRLAPCLLSCWKHAYPHSPSAGPTSHCASLSPDVLAH